MNNNYTASVNVSSTSSYTSDQLFINTSLTNDFSTNTLDNDISDLFRDNFGMFSSQDPSTSTTGGEMDQNLSDILEDLKKAVTRDETRSHNNSITEENNNRKRQNSIDLTKLYQETVLDDPAQSLMVIQRELELELEQMEAERIERLRNPLFHTMPAYEKRAKQEEQWREAIRTARRAQSLGSIPLHRQQHDAFNTRNRVNHGSTRSSSYLFPKPIVPPINKSKNNLDLTCLELPPTQNTNNAEEECVIIQPRPGASKLSKSISLGPGRSVRTNLMMNTKKHLSSMNHFPANSRIFNRSLKELQTTADAISKKYLKNLKDVKSEVGATVQRPQFVKPYFKPYVKPKDKTNLIKPRLSRALQRNLNLKNMKSSPVIDLTASPPHQPSSSTRITTRINGSRARDGEFTVIDDLTSPSPRLASTSTRLLADTSKDTVVSATVAESSMSSSPVVPPSSSDIVRSDVILSPVPASSSMPSFDNLEQEPLCSSKSPSPVEPVKDILQEATESLSLPFMDSLDSITNSIHASEKEASKTNTTKQVTSTANTPLKAQKCVVANPMLLDPGSGIVQLVPTSSRPTSAATHQLRSSLPSHNHPTLPHNNILSLNNNSGVIKRSRPILPNPHPPVQLFKSSSGTRFVSPPVKLPLPPLPRRSLFTESKFYPKPRGHNAPVKLPITGVNNNRVIKTLVLDLANNKPTILNKTEILKSPMYPDQRKMSSTPIFKLLDQVEEHQEPPEPCDNCPKLTKFLPYLGYSMRKALAAVGRTRQIVASTLLCEVKFTVKDI